MLPHRVEVGFQSLLRCGPCCAVCFAGYTMILKFRVCKFSALWHMLCCLVLVPGVHCMLSEMLDINSVIVSWLTAGHVLLRFQHWVALSFCCFQCCAIPAPSSGKVVCASPCGVCSMYDLPSALGSKLQVLLCVFDRAEGFWRRIGGWKEETFGVACEFRAWFRRFWHWLWIWCGRRYSSLCKQSNCVWCNSRSTTINARSCGSAFMFQPRGEADCVEWWMQAPGVLLSAWIGFVVSCDSYLQRCPCLHNHDQCMRGVFNSYLRGMSITVDKTCMGACSCPSGSNKKIMASAWVAFLIHIWFKQIVDSAPAWSQRFPGVITDQSWCLVCRCFWLTLFLVDTDFGLRFFGMAPAMIIPLRCFWIIAL